MSRKGREDKKRPVSATESFGDSPFSSLATSGLSQASIPQGNSIKVKQDDRIGIGERLEVRREKSGRGGKTVTTIAGFPRRVNSPMRTSLLKRMKTSLGTGGTWNGDCMELQGDKRSEIVPWLTSMGFKPVLAGG
jgi:translation initiation factor 1